jgi:hypothetical protein
MSSMKESTSILQSKNQALIMCKESVVWECCERTHPDSLIPDSLIQKRQNMLEMSRPPG